MSEPATSAIVSVTQASGITILGIATGLDPVLIVAGAAGGWWALSYLESPGRALARANRIALSSILAAWGSPVVVGLNFLPLPENLPEFPIKIVVSIGIGLIAIDIIGKGLMSFVREKVKQLSKSQEQEPRK